MSENNQFGLDTTGSQNSDASYLCYIFFVQNMNFLLIKFNKEVIDVGLACFRAIDCFS